MAKETTTRTIAALLLALVYVGRPVRALRSIRRLLPKPTPSFSPCGCRTLPLRVARAVGRMAPSPSEFDLNSTLDRPNGAPRKVGGVTAGDWGSLTANATIRDVDASMAWEDPVGVHEWKSDGTWRLPVAGPLFVYGQFGGGGSQVEQQDTQMSGRTGVGCKWAPVQDAEFTVRAGPSVTYTDPLRPDRVQEALGVSLGSAGALAVARQDRP